MPNVFLSKLRYHVRLFLLKSGHGSIPSLLSTQSFAPQRPRRPLCMMVHHLSKLRYRFQARLPSPEFRISDRGQLCTSGSQCPSLQQTRTNNAGLEIWTLQSMDDVSFAKSRYQDRACLPSPLRRCRPQLPDIWEYQGILGESCLT